jgi:hypothetical protein
VTTRRAYPISASFIDKAMQPTSFQTYASASDVTDYNADPTLNTKGIRKLIDSVVALSIATKVSEQVTNQGIEFPTSVPTDDQAYRSSKLEISYQDTVTGKWYTNTVPARNTAKYNTFPRSKDVILTVAEGGTTEIETFVANFNAVAKSELGNACVIKEIKVAGRSS